MTRRTIGVALTIFFALAAGPALGAKKPNRFEGTCHMSGEVRFGTPLGNLPRATTFTDSATGACTGTLNGEPMNDLPFVNSVSGTGFLSCGGGRTSTHDTLTFARGKHGTQVHITVEAAGGLTQLVGYVRGATAGRGVVEANLAPYVDQSVLDACQAGRLESVRYEATARTITPISG